MDIIKYQRYQVSLYIPLYRDVSQVLLTWAWLPGEGLRNPTNLVILNKPGRVWQTLEVPYIPIAGGFVRLVCLVHLV